MYPELLRYVIRGILIPQRVEYLHDVAIEIADGARHQRRQ